MEETMLVTQALDERDLLMKKIRQKIQQASFMDYKKNNEKKTAINHVTEEEFADQARRSYQQITDMIKRYEKIDAAIVESNAGTRIRTSYGEYTVAAAISLRKRMKGNRDLSGLYSRMEPPSGEGQDSDFDTWIIRQLEKNYIEAAEGAWERNKNLDSTAEAMRLSILGKDSKGKDDGKPLEVVEEYIRQNKADVADPLNAKALIDELKMKHDTLLSELDTQIKVSNATTVITIQ